MFLRNRTSLSVIVCTGAFPRWAGSCVRRYVVGPQLGTEGESHMRFIFGLIIGVLLTVGGAYVADSMSGAAAKPMVNWDVVQKNLDNVTALAREGWRKIAG